MTQGTELAHAAINELEQRLLDTHQARQAAMLASSTSEAIALQKLAENAQSALQAARLDDPIAPIIAPFLRAVHGGREWTTSPDQAPKPRKVSTDMAGPLIVPVLDGGEDAEPVEPVKRRKRKPDYVKQVKRAMAAGLNVRSANFTADGVSMTFGEAEAPVDDTVIETADELRKLI
jgi:capsid protein